MEGQDYRTIVTRGSAVGARHKVPHPRLALVSLRALLRLSWLFANVPVIGGKKSHCIVYKRQSVFYALLRRFYYALGNHFAHWRAPIFPPEHSVPSPWCHAKQSASRRPEETPPDSRRRSDRAPMRGTPHTCQTFMPIRSLQASPCFSAFPEWLGGPPSSGPLCLYAFDITRL